MFNIKNKKNRVCLRENWKSVFSNFSKFISERSYNIKKSSVL